MYMSACKPRDKNMEHRSCWYLIMCRVEWVESAGLHNLLHAYDDAKFYFVC